MILFTRDEQQMISHMASEMRDMTLTRDGYTEADISAVDKLKALSTPALVVTGDELDQSETLELLRQIVRAELDHWVPDASQRLIYRATRALGYGTPYEHRAPDHGPDRQNHPLVSEWVAGLYLHRCVSCGRLFRD